MSLLRTTCAKGISGRLSNAWLLVFAACLVCLKPAIAREDERDSQSAPLSELYCDETDYEIIATHSSAQLEKDSDDIYMLSRRAIAYAKSDPSKAVADCARALELDSNSAYTNYACGHVRMELGEYDAAIGHFLRASELEPHSVRGPIGLAYVRYYQERYDDARDHLSDAFEIDPSNRTAYHLSARNAWADGEYDESLAAYALLIDTDLEHPCGYLERARVRGIVGDLEGVKADIAKVIGLYPNNAQMHYQAAWALYDADAVPDALSALEDAIALDAADARFYGLRGNIQFMGDDPQLAVGAFTKAIEIDSTDASYYEDRGDVYVLLGEFEKAIEDYSSAIVIEPDNSTLYVSRSVAKAASGDLKGAMQDSLESVNKGTGITSSGVVAALMVGFVAVIVFSVVLVLALIAFAFSRRGRRAPISRNDAPPPLPPSRAS